MLQPRELPLSHGATYGREREMHEEDRVICEEPCDRAGLAKACGNLGNCMCSTGEYMKAISYLKMEYGVAKELEREKERASAAMNIGAAMRLHIRADRQAAAASPALSPQMAPLCPELAPSQGAAPRHQTIGARGVGGGGWCMCSPALRPIRSPELSGANALARLTPAQRAPPTSPGACPQPGVAGVTVVVGDNYSHTCNTWLRAARGMVGGARCAGVKRASAFAVACERARGA